ncbi:MAG: hypothetical protein ACRD98_07085, partial [Nitrososphaera sp.]
MEIESLSNDSLSDPKAELGPHGATTATVETSNNERARLTPLVRDGTSLDEAANILAAHAGRSATDVATALRMVGFIDEVLALGEIIRTLSLMVERFKALQEVLPNLPKLFWGFELVGSLDDTLCAPTAYHKAVNQRPSFANRTAEANFLQWLLFHYPPKNELAVLPHEHPLKLDVLAVWWLYGSAVRLYGDQLPQWRVKGKTDRTDPSAEIEVIEFFRGNSEKADAIEIGAAQAGYPTWLEQIVAFNEGAQSGQPENDYGLNQLRSVQTPAAIDRLAGIQERDLGRLTTMDRESQDLSMPPLSERELLKSHWYFPRPTELESLKGFLQNNSVPAAPEFFEACLI